MSDELLTREERESLEREIEALQVKIAAAEDEMLRQMDLAHVLQEQWKELLSRLHDDNEQRRQVRSKP